MSERAPRDTRDPSNRPFRWIGQPIRRVEDRRLLRGEGRFVGDLPHTGALEVAFLRSSYAHARIRGISTDAARRLPGVHAVLVAADIEGKVPPLSTAHWNTPAAVQERANPVVRPDLQPLLASDKVCYVGEPVAVVIADSRYVAEDALEAIEVAYEPLSVLVNADSALEPGAPLIHEEWGDNVALRLHVQIGSPDEAFSDAQTIARGRFRSHRYTGVPLETRGVMAAIEPNGETLTVWSSTQVAHRLRDLLAAMLDLPTENVRVVAPDVGGGFGVKGHVYIEEVLLAFLARTLGRPVRWIEDRREHMLAAAHAREGYHDIELAADGEGHILGLRDRIIFDMGAYNPLGLVLPYNSVAHLFGPYRVPSASIQAVVAVTNKTPHAPYRGAGRPESVFAMERALDRLANQLDIDPLELRRRNLVRADEMPFDTGLLYRDGQPLVYDSGDYPRMYEEAEALLDYDYWRSAQSASLAGTRRIGIGLAGYVEGTGIGPFESGSVSVDASGNVSVATGTCSQGQGHATTFAQLVAEVLEVPMERIRVTGGDTGAIPFGFGTVASRGIVTGGSAVTAASREVREKALRVAAHLLEASVDDVRLIDGAAQVLGAPDRSIALAAIAQALRPGLPRPGGESPGLSATAYFEPPTVTYASGVHAAVVEVDLETGRTELLRYVVVHDCGTVVNPVIVDAQIIGGVAQGIGGALYENLVYDSEGQLLTTSLLDYLLPTSAEVPVVQLGHQEYRSPRNPLGLKGLGEGGAIGPPAALANAIEDALRGLGVVVEATPLDPNTVRSLVRQAQRSAGHQV